MKRRFNAERSSAPHEKIPSIQTDSPPAEMSADPSDELGERLKNLPIELRKKILCSFAPKERRHLRLVCKAMLHIVDASMFDVQEIFIDFSDRYKPSSRVFMVTINPFNGAKEEHEHSGVRSSLPFLLKWAGAHLKTLSLFVSSSIYEEKDFDWRPLYQVFETLNSENACPKLKKLSLGLRKSFLDNNEIILGVLLKYVTKRQLQVKAIDHPIPFLQSLTLTLDPYPIFPDIPAVDSEKWCKDLQDILDQCHGLKELEIDGLLVWKGLPIEALRYPKTLTLLSSERLSKAPGDLQAIVSNCPNLQIVIINDRFPRDDAEVDALASLSDLRELTLECDSTEEEIVRTTAQCLAAFDDHLFEASIARPWPQLNWVAVDCYKDEDDEFPTYCLLLRGSSCCITSLHLRWFDCMPHTRDAQSVQQLFKALNSKDACPLVMELNINSCEVVNRLKDSLIMRKGREPQTLKWWLNGVGDDPLRIPEPPVYDILNGLLAYVTKRQSEVRLRKPFLRSLSIDRAGCSCRNYRRSYYDRDELRDLLEYVYSLVQQILDQCHGLEELIMESLNDKRINPNKRKGRELMELMPLRFPTTLKKLNGVSLG